MALSPAERAKEYRKRKATAQPDKVTNTARVTAPAIEAPTERLTLEGLAGRVHQLEITVATLKAIFKRVDAIEDTLEGMQKPAPKPPNPLDTLKAHPLIRGAMLRPCCPSTTAEPHAPDCLVSPAP